MEEKDFVNRIRYEYRIYDEAKYYERNGNPCYFVENKNIVKCHKIGLEFNDEVYMSLENLFKINGWELKESDEGYFQLVQKKLSEDDHLMRFGKDKRENITFVYEDKTYIIFMSEFEGIVIFQRIDDLGNNDMIIYWKEKCSEGNFFCEKGRLIHRLKSDCIEPYDLGNY